MILIEEQSSSTVTEVQLSAYMKELELVLVKFELRDKNRQ